MYDAGIDIAIDENGSAVVTGITRSPDFPTVNPLQSRHAGGGDVFVAKLDSTGASLTYSTFIGGSDDDTPLGIANSVNGEITIGGSTHSSDFPTKDAIQLAYGGGLRDGFVCKLNPGGAELVFSTFLGGSGEDNLSGLAVDQAGNPHISGWTLSNDFPTLNAFQGNLAGTSDGFITKLSGDGRQMEFSTYLGGSEGEQITDLTLDSSYRICIVGSTGSLDFPLQNPLQPNSDGPGDVFVSVFNLDASNLLFSTYLGGKRWRLRRRNRSG